MSFDKVNYAMSAGEITTLDKCNENSFMVVTRDR